MKPQERYAKFLEGMSSSAESFSENWQTIEAESEEDVLRFREILVKALEQGEERESTEHQVIVHQDWIEAQAHHREASEFLEALNKVQASIHLSGLDSSKKGVSTINNPRATGFLSLNGLETFFERLKGYHPNDSFRLHGAEWHACMTQSALQLTAMSIGKWWSRSDIKQLKNQKALMTQEADMNLAPVRFGLALDVGGAYTIYRHAQADAKVSYAFEDEETRIMPKPKKPKIRWQPSRQP